jgi:hypothetical protein
MDQDNQQPPRNLAPRRPYEPPKIEETASFEHLVLSCGKNTIGACSRAPGGVRS